MIKSSIYTTNPFLDSVTVKLSEVVLSQGTNPLQSEIIFYCNPILEDVIDPSSIGKKKLITDGCETGCSSSLIDRKPVRHFRLCIYVFTCFPPDITHLIGSDVFSRTKRACLSVRSSGSDIRLAQTNYIQSFVLVRQIM